MQKISKKEAEAAADKRRAEHKPFDRNRNQDRRNGGANQDRRRPQNKDGQNHFDKKRPQGQGNNNQGNNQGHNKFDKPVTSSEVFTVPANGKTNRRDRDKKTW